MYKTTFPMFAALLMWPCAATAASDSIVTDAGRQLARQWCAECHLVEAEQSQASSTIAPTFFEVARDPAVTETSLRVFLASPHENMPDIVLSNQQTEEIIAYILSLRTQ